MKYSIKIQIYLTFTILSTIAVYAVATMTGEFEHHLKRIAEERISSEFVWETIVLNGLIFVVAVTSYLARWFNRRRSPSALHSSNHKEFFVEEWIAELPRAAYLLGAVTSSVFYAAAIKSLLAAHGSLEAIKFIGFGFVFTFVFGVWGHLFDLLVETSWIRILKGVAIYGAIFAIILIAVTAPPISMLAAFVIFRAWSQAWRKFHEGVEKGAAHLDSGIRVSSRETLAAPIDLGRPVIPPEKRLANPTKNSKAA